jgi:hypothetical protein
MSREHLNHVLHRARAYAGFRTALLRDPDDALAEYDLTPAERAALRAHDAARLLSLGAEAELAQWWSTVAVNERARA